MFIPETIEDLKRVPPGTPCIIMNYRMPAIFIECEYTKNNNYVLRYFYLWDSFQQRHGYLYSSCGQGVLNKIILFNKEQLKNNVELLEKIELFEKKKEDPIFFNKRIKPYLIRLEVENLTPLEI